MQNSTVFDKGLRSTVGVITIPLAFAGAAPAVSAQSTSAINDPPRMKELSREELRKVHAKGVTKDLLRGAADDVEGSDGTIKGLVRSVKNRNLHRLGTDLRSRLPDGFQSLIRRTRRTMLMETVETIVNQESLFTFENIKVLVEGVTRTVDVLTRRGTPGDK